MSKNMFAFIMANLLACMIIYLFMFAGLKTHQWISAWWYLGVWLALQVFMRALVRQRPKTDREARPWLYHKWPS